MRLVAKQDGIVLEISVRMIFWSSELARNLLGVRSDYSLPRAMPQSRKKTVVFVLLYPHTCV